MMGATHFGTARVSDELHAVGIVYGDRDSFSRSVSPRAMRAGRETLPRHSTGWAFVGVDFNNATTTDKGGSLAYGYFVRGGLRTEWEATDDWEAHRAMLNRFDALRCEWDAPGGHGYGDESDCLCGRNFDTVRGLREHLTKSRLAVTS